MPSKNIVVHKLLQLREMPEEVLDQSKWGSASFEAQELAHLEVGRPPIPRCELHCRRLGASNAMGKTKAFTFEESYKEQGPPGVTQAMREALADAVNEF